MEFAIYLYNTFTEEWYIWNKLTSSYSSQGSKYTGILGKYWTLYQLQNVDEHLKRHVQNCFFLYISYITQFQIFSLEKYKEQLHPSLTFLMHFVNVD